MKAVINRSLAVILLLMVALLAWIAVAEPLRVEYVRDRQSIDSQRDNITRFEAIAARLDEYQANLRRQRQNPELSRSVLRANSATLAAANLQQRVKSVVERQGGALVSTQVLETVPEAPFTRIRINVRMLLSVPILQQVLHEIEAQTPYLTVRQLLVTNRQWRGRKPRRRNKPLESLDVRMVIVAYWSRDEQALRAGQG